jgi:hypothetical protein
MIDNLKKILNEDQDPKAIEKISSKLENLLMNNEEVGYIAVQKKPAVTILPDSIVVTNKRIILCKPKNLGLSMEFIDYDWDIIEASFVKEGILGSEFTFSTKSELTYTVDYLPKNQARKLYTFAKEQLDLLKNLNTTASNFNTENITKVDPIIIEEPIEEEVEVEETLAEEFTDYEEILPVSFSGYRDEKQFPDDKLEITEKGLGELTQDELFAKLQNYKKLLDNGLILQAEYDTLKKEVLMYL